MRPAPGVPAQAPSAIRSDRLTAQPPAPGPLTATRVADTIRAAALALLALLVWSPGTLAGTVSAIAPAPRPQSFVLPPPLAVSLAVGTERVTTGTELIAGNRSPIVVERPIPPAAAVHSRRPAGSAAGVAIRPATPWYKTTWGIAGIGLVATGAAMGLDGDINHFAQTHLSYNFRDHVPLNIADALTDGSLIFAGTTWFQSPWAGPKLAHASSVALTAGAITTLETFGLKYAFGRERPAGPDSSPFRFHPFSSRFSMISGSNVVHLGRGNTASLPSGHTAVAFAIITPYAQIYHQPWLYAIPITVGLARIAAVDGHWASDVVAGGFLGWLTADLTLRYFPDSDFGIVLFGDGVGVYKRF
jgi:membrane-associated phospholipid phosphatase